MKSRMDEYNKTTSGKKPNGVLKALLDGYTLIHKGILASIPIPKV